MNEETSPLAGKTVVVTRPEEAAREMVTLLRRYHANPLIMPLIRTECVKDIKAKSTAVSSLEQCQGILFSSVQGVDYFFKWLNRVKAGDQTDGGRSPHLENDRQILTLLNEKALIAVGPKTAERVKHYGLTHVRIPQQYLQEGMAKLLPHILPKGSRLLYPRAKEVRPYLVEALREKGYEVEELIVYQTRLIDQVNPVYWQAILSGEADVVTFTSASTVKAFDRIFSSSDHPGKDKRKLPVFACIGPVTAQEARLRGYRVDIVAEEHTVLGLLKAMIAYFST